MEEKIDFETVFGLAAKGDVCSEIGCGRKPEGLGDRASKCGAGLSTRKWSCSAAASCAAPDVILPAMEEHMRRYVPALPLSIPIIADGVG